MAEEEKTEKRTGRRRELRTGEKGLKRKNTRWKFLSSTIKHVPRDGGRRARKEANAQGREEGVGMREGERAYDVSSLGHAPRQASFQSLTLPALGPIFLGVGAPDSCLVV